MNFPLQKYFYGRVTIHPGIFHRRALRTDSPWMNTIALRDQF